MAGYLPPGLTQDDLDRAIAMSQGRQPDMSQAPAPEMPQQAPIEAAPPVVEPPVQAEPTPPAPPVEQEEMAAEPESAPLIEAPTGKPKENIAQLQNDVIGLQNKRAESMPGLGDKNGLDEKAYTKLAETNQRSSEQNKATADAAKHDLEESRRREAVNRDRAEQIWKEMEASKQAPPDSTVTKVLGILGSVLAMGSNKGGTAQGVQLLMGMLGSDKERWAQERAANSDLYKKALEAADNERSTQLEHLEGSQKVAALEAHEINDSLEAAKNMGLGKSATAAIADMQNAFVTEAKQGILKGEELKQKELDAKAAAAHKLKLASREAAQRDALARMGEPELQALLEQGNLSELGQQILASKIKARQAGVKGEAETLEAQNKALASGDPKAAGPKTEYEGKVQAMVAPLAGPDGPLARLESKLYDKNGKELDNKDVDLPYVGTERGGSSWVPERAIPTDVIQHQTDINTLRQVFVRARSGAGIKETEAEDELRAMGLYSKDDQVAAQGLKQLVKSIRGLDKYGNLQAPGTPAKGAGAKLDLEWEAPSGGPGAAVPNESAEARARRVAQEYLASQSGAGGGM